MANALYPKWKEALLNTSTSASAVLTNTNVRVAFLDTGTYTYSNAHDFYNDLSGVYPNTRGGGAALGTKTYTDGVFDAADVTFTAFSNGSVSVEGIVIYIDDGSADATSRLVAFIDTNITGMSPNFTPSGSDVTIQWNVSGIFQL